MVDGPPYQLSGDELHNTRQNLSDEHTVVDGPSNTTTKSQLTRDELNTSMKLLCQMDPPNKNTCLIQQYMK